MLYLHLGNLCFILAALTLEGVVPQVCDGNEATEITHVDPVAINVNGFSWPELETEIQSGSMSAYLYGSDTSNSLSLRNWAAP